MNDAFELCAEDSWKSLGQQGDQTSQLWGRSTLNTHWKGWCWSSRILVIWWEEMTHCKSPWCWESLKAEGEEGVRGLNDWTASPMQWTWTWAKFWEMVDRDAWYAAVHGVAKSQKWLGNWTTNNNELGVPIMILLVFWCILTYVQLQKKSKVT